MRRRTFLVSSCRASIGLSLLSIVGHAQDRDLNLQRAAAGDWEFWIADLEDQIHGLMGRISVPGLSITVIRDAKLAWQGEFGFRNNESRVPVDSDTVFEAQSMSNPVFAYVVMKLCEKGTLDLDEPLINYTPIDGLETPLTDQLQTKAQDRPKSTSHLFRPMPRATLLFLTPSLVSSSDTC